MATFSKSLIERFAFVAVLAGLWSFLAPASLGASPLDVTDDAAPVWSLVARASAAPDPGVGHLTTDVSEVADSELLELEIDEDPEAAGATAEVAAAPHPSALLEPQPARATASIRLFAFSARAPPRA